MVAFVVIGGGPTGITAAREAAALGAEVTLVSPEALGGRANWSSLLPSKVYLTAADHLGEAAHNGKLGLAGPPPRPNLPAVRQRIVALAEAASRLAQEQLERDGVRIVTGRARILGPSTVEIVGDGPERQRLTFERALIATGSGPSFPPGIRPDGVRILAPRLAGKLAEWPAHVIVIGGGVTGAEFTYLFNRMGSAVTWVTDLERMLPRSDPDIAAVLEGVLAAQGVVLLKSRPVVAVAADESGVTVTLEGGSTLTGSHAFLALGRRPDVADLGLDAAGVVASDQGITVDAYGRTSQAHIYAAGDVCGPPYVANRGQARARVAARHALAAETSPFRPETIVEAVYTSPQVAQVGLTETEAAARGREVRVQRASYGEALKPRLAEAIAGFVKLVVDAGNRQVVGAAAVGAGAADVLAPVAVAMTATMTVDALAALFPAYPTYGELIGIAARAG